MRYQPIENYGVIGDLHTIALAGMDGSIDFFCFPRFDSPSVFAAILDRKRGGRFRVAPAIEGGHRKQIYLPDSNILLSRFLYEEGVAEISDFMAVEEDGERWHDLVRRAKTIRGEIRFRMLCDPRFDYGRCGHRVEKGDKEVVFLPEKKGIVPLRLRANVPLRVSKGAATADFTLRAGETAFFVLEEARAGQEPPSSGGADYVSAAFKDTLNFWRRWVAHSKYRGRWREIVNRSALTLKLLTSSTNGSIVAAPTFGLPEEIGGTRNWDYRYTWIRDASFTLYALIRLGYTKEAGAFMRWIEARCGELGPDGSLQVMYGIDGRHELDEERLSHLEGYRKSAPVRIGNAAYRQLQLDIYGELMDSVYLHDKYGAPVSHDFWKDLSRLIDWVCRNWKRRDQGIWEMRSGPKHLLYSRLMCWVAVDRGIRLSSKRSLPAPLDRWHKVRDAIYRDIFGNFWHPGRKAFMQSRQRKTLDASNLLMPLVKFISPTDPRWLSTMEAIDRDLVVDSHVYRYRGDNGLPDGIEGKEGTFTMCSFWYAECLSRAGNLPKARYYFEKMLSNANHLGLFSEELGPSGEHLGNYPQAFTHLGLISAAYSLDRHLADAPE